MTTVDAKTLRNSSTLRDLCVMSAAAKSPERVELGEGVYYR